MGASVETSKGLAANGAPAGEPEVWNENVAVYTPLKGHSPEPELVAVSSAFAKNFDVETYLAEERTKDLLRFSTAGSVDDGKSTLIGRLLYDTQSVYDDQVQSIRGKGTTAPGVLDLALLTDGLRAEREQGITIDVAYRYFATAKRKFIIADTPGHEQYTRNMATGASTADVAVVLVDARKGVLIQSRRHAYITALLGVRHVIVAVNKMDLVAFSQETFDGIVREFRTFFQALDVDGHERTALHFVPVSALAGDNVVTGSSRMPWYTGQTLLGLLEAIPSSHVITDAPFRMAVQRVVRPHLDFRGFAGQINAGTVRVDDRIAVLPSGKTSRVGRIVTFDGDVDEAFAPLSVTLVLEDELDVSRGDFITSADSLPYVATRVRASLVWMYDEPLDTGRRYLLKQGSRTVSAKVPELISVVRLSDDASPAGDTLGLNGIGNVVVEGLQALVFDTYADNRSTGAFVLLDPDSNATVAAGMVRSVDARNADASSRRTVELKLSPSHALGLHGTDAALAIALDALRRAGVLQEEL